MEKKDFTMRRVMRKRQVEKPRHIHKTWITLRAGFKALFTNILLASQCALMAAAYGIVSYLYPIFWYTSLGLTALTGAYVSIHERDGQIKTSWLFLLIISCGSGYIIYFISMKKVNYGLKRRRFKKIAQKAEPYFKGDDISYASAEVKSDCEYIKNTAGYVPYTGTDVKYYKDARKFFDNTVARIEQAKEFVFIEFFIVADGVLLERLIDVFRRKVAEGVTIKLLYDDAGCQGVFSHEAKQRIKEAGVEMRVFMPMFRIFNVGLDYRDHRKIVIVDGETGYVGGCNVSDCCTNEKRMEGMWKDSGIRMDGAAVDGLTLTFMRNWEFATKCSLDYEKYLNRHTKTQCKSVVLPYAGGPEIGNALCRGVYKRVISSAKEKLFIMTPYFIPDGEIYSLIKAKAVAGADVRIVLPDVPDYPFIFRVTRSNAESLIKYGVKIYYMHGHFVHSKVVLTENCMTCGSVNMDMRAFYQELDNGVYTDDREAMVAAEQDFEEIFNYNQTAVKKRHGPFGTLVNAVLKLASPLM